jgi:hypothetical protein
VPRRSWNGAERRYSPASRGCSPRSPRTTQATRARGRSRSETRRPGCFGPKRILRPLRSERGRSRGERKHARRRAVLWTLFTQAPRRYAFPEIEPFAAPSADAPSTARRLGFGGRMRGAGPPIPAPLDALPPRQAPRRAPGAATDGPRSADTPRGRRTLSRRPRTPRTPRSFLRCGHFPAVAVGKAEGGEVARCLACGELGPVREGSEEALRALRDLAGLRDEAHSA